MAKKQAERREQFVVTVVVPAGVSAREMAAYIREAVGTWNGQLHPDDPLFGLDADKVKVRRVTER